MTQDTHPARQTPKAFAVIKDLTLGGNIADTFARLAELLAPSGLNAALKIQLLERTDAPAMARQTSSYTITVLNGKATVNLDTSAKADVELITTPETWWEIAAGKIAPHDAFLKGLMRVRGKVSVAQDMLKHVAGSQGRTHLCVGAK